MTPQQQEDFSNEPIGKVSNPNNKPHPPQNNSAESLLETFYAEFVIGQRCEVREARGK